MLLALYKFTIFLSFFGTPRVLYIFFALFLHTDRKIFSNTAYTRNPPKNAILFRQQQYSTVLMGVLSVFVAVLCFYIIFFPSTLRATPSAPTHNPGSVLSLLATGARRDKVVADHPHHAALAWKHFLKMCFFRRTKRQKKFSTSPIPPPTVAAERTRDLKVPPPKCIIHPYFTLLVI